MRFFPLVLSLHLICSGWVKAETNCKRIVSLAPSVTETLFSLGLGDAVVGVTKFDHYPKEVDSITRIGGFLDLNTELVLTLEPDLIVLLKEQANLSQRFEQLGLATLLVEHRNVLGILESLTTISQHCGVANAGQKVRHALESKVEMIKELVSQCQRPGVAVIAGRDLGVGGIRAAFLSGNDGFYSDLVQLAGGRFVYQGATVSLPGISLEGLIALKPDFILDIVPGFERLGLSGDDLKHDWEQARANSALQNTKIIFLSDDFAEIPGPRFIQLLEKIARAIHPEKFDE